MNDKKEFLISELWMLTFNAAFQRTDIYKEGVSTEKKAAWKERLAAYVEVNILPMYQKGTVAEDIHLNNIEDINHRFNDDIFKKTDRTFGIAQKILNLYLKYMWVIDEINFPPPHFPIDRRIQEALKLKPLVSWTKAINSSKDYMDIINRAKESPTAKNFNTLAEMELHEFSRSNLYANLLKSSN